MMNIAWAYSINTVQYINNAIYGATVLGGNILKTELNGTSVIVWENDYSDPHKGGVFLYSLVFNQKFYLFPYSSDYIVIFDIYTYEVEKVFFEDKGKEEKIYPHIFEEKIIMFGLDSGCVWELGNSILRIDAKNQSFGNLFKLRGVVGERYTLFYGIEKKVAVIYDCKNHGWISFETFDYVNAGFAEGEYIWYIAGNRLFRQSIETKSYSEILTIPDAVSNVSMTRIDECQICVVENDGDRTYLIDKQTLDVRRIRFDFISNGNNHAMVGLDRGYLFFADFKILDWMIWKGDKYVICDMRDQSVYDIPIFNMEDRTKQMIDERYARIVWKIAPNKMLQENDKEGLELLIKSLNMSAFDE